MVIAKPGKVCWRKRALGTLHNRNRKAAGEGTITDPLNWQERFIEFDGLGIRYRQAGQGHQVVMLEDWDWGLDSLRDALAAKFSVISLQIPLAEFERATASVPWAHKASEIAASAIAEAVSGSYTLVGSCFGANVALWQAISVPQQVEALVLISPTNIQPEEPPLPMTPEEAMGYLLTHPEQKQESPKQISETAAQYLELLRGAGNFVHDVEAQGRLGDIQCSTLVLFGTEDRLVLAEAGRVYSRDIPNCSLGLVYDAGHLILADRPEALAEVVVDFVERRETFVVGQRSQVTNP